MRSRPAYGLLFASVVVVLLLLFLYRVAEVLFLLFVAVLFSLYLGAITDFLQRRLRLPRIVGLTVALLLSLAALGALLWLIVPPVLEQTQELLTTLPTLLAQWERDLQAVLARYPLLKRLLPGPGAPEATLTSPLETLGGYFAGLFPYLYGGVHGVILFISVLVMGAYLTLRPRVYAEGLVALVPPVHRDLARDILADLSATLRAWITGQILAMIFLGVLTWVGLRLLGVPYSLAFAVFTGVAVMVPFFGTITSTLLPALFVLGAQGVVPALLVVLLGVVVHLVEANFVHPLIMERQVNLPPVLSILSVLVMAELLGFIGMLVAVPALATTMVIVRRIYVERLLEGKGFRRSVRAPGSELELLPEAELTVPHEPRSPREPLTS